jgi:hypothetical protein
MRNLALAMVMGFGCGLLISIAYIAMVAVGLL